ncbi:unnamed protein product [Brachionus calyciflorus]|uniref:Uncharacterized protein n=1 Tax=Brachionus calyciflorus TaxID=104777 RepID=A0A814BVW6_9BILA|nr:unnamed protein product [Brachionus calyciflorus]
MNLESSNLQDHVKKLAEKNTRLSLALEAALNENKIIKNELVVCRVNQTELGNRAKISQESSDRAENLLKKVNTQIENWKYKYKLIQQRINEIENIEKNVANRTEALLNENDKLREIFKQNDTFINNLKSECDSKVKDYESRLEKLIVENERLSFENLELKSKIDEIQQQLIKYKDLSEILREQNEKIQCEKSQLELHSFKNQQNSLNLSMTNEKITLNLKQKEDLIRLLETECDSIRTEMNHLKISNDLEINDLRSQIKKLDLRLKSEIDDKTNLKSLLEEKEEEIYFTQLNNKELVESLRKYRSKKFIDNFTQTIFMINNLNMVHQSTQTLVYSQMYQRCVFTQTPVIITKNFSVQTEKLIVKNSCVQTEGLTTMYSNWKDNRELNKNLSYRTDGWDLRDIELDEENRPPQQRHQVKNGPSNAKSLFDGFSKQVKKVRFSD